MKNWKWFSLILLFCCSLSFAKETRKQGFVDIGREELLYVDYLKQSGAKHTLVVLNGLTYDTTDWEWMMPTLRKGGYNILRYDMRGQGKTVLNHGPETEIIKMEEQVADLDALLNALKIQHKVDLVGLSYGGGALTMFGAYHPERVRNLIMMSPFVGPLSAQNAMIQMEVDITRLLNPLLPWSNEELYQYFLTLYYYGTAPLAEPTVLRNPYILQATLKMTQGLFLDPQPFLAVLPAGSVHLMTANQDQYIPQEQFDGFWALMPDSVKGSRIRIHGSEHKMPGMIPNYAGSWINLIMAEDPRIAEGRIFEGTSFTGQTQSNDGSISFTLPRW